MGGLCERETGGHTVPSFGFGFACGLDVTMLVTDDSILDLGSVVVWNRGKGRREVGKGLGFTHRSLEHVGIAVRRRRCHEPPGFGPSLFDIGDGDALLESHGRHRFGLGERLGKLDGRGQHLRLEAVRGFGVNLGRSRVRSALNGAASGAPDAGVKRAGR